MIKEDTHCCYYCTCLFPVKPLTSLTVLCVNMASTRMFVCANKTQGWGGRVNSTIPHYECNIHKNVCTQHKNGVCMLLWTEGEGIKWLRQLSFVWDLWGELGGRGCTWPVNCKIIQHLNTFFLAIEVQQHVRSDNCLCFKCHCCFCWFIVVVHNTMKRYPFHIIPSKNNNIQHILVVLDQFYSQGTLFCNVRERYSSWFHLV